MSKQVAVQSVTEEFRGPDVAAPAVEKNTPLVAETVPSEPKKQVATATAVEKIAAKAKPAKKALADKPAKKVAAERPVQTPKIPAKPEKKSLAVAKEEFVEAPKAEKAAKEKRQAPKKPKLIRDSFTIPETDYALFATLKQRALTAGIEVKKSEILRAALISLANLDDAGFAKALGLVERIKTGRPKK